MNTDLILVLVALFIIADALLLAYIFSRRRSKFSREDKIYFSQQWMRIKSEKDLKHKVMDADKLIEKAMKKYGFSSTFGDNLKKHKHFFSDINHLWSAHKLRNKIAHEIDYRPKQHEVQNAMSGFEKALKDFKVL